MTTITVRAKYENGHLIPTTPLNLVNGEEVTINITPETERDRVRAALAEIAILPDPSNEDEPELEALLELLGEAFKGGRDSLELINEDRGPI